MDNDLWLGIARDWGLWGAALAFAGVTFWRLVWPEIQKTRDFTRAQNAKEREHEQSVQRLQVEFYAQALGLMQSMGGQLGDIRLAVEQWGENASKMPPKDW